MEKNGKLQGGLISSVTIALKGLDPSESKIIRLSLHTAAAPAVQVGSQNRDVLLVSCETTGFLFPVRVQNSFKTEA